VTKVPITPATRVAQLLDAYPQLEDLLVKQAPAFERLKNPILRRTVARLTTLERAAGIAGIDVRTLVRRLREAAGLRASTPTPCSTAARRRFPRCSRRRAHSPTTASSR